VGRLLFLLVVARELGPRLFGVYSLLFALVEMLAVASGTGHADYLTREAAKDARVGWGLAWQLTWLRLACTIPLTACGLGIFRVLGYRHPVLLAGAGFALSLFPRTIQEAVQGVLRGLGRYGTCLALELVYDVGLIAGGALLLVNGGGLRGVIAVEVAAVAAAAVASVAIAIKLRTRERFRLGGRELLRQSSIFNLFAFVVNLYDRIDVVLLSKLAGDYATGVYSAAYRPLGAVQFVPYGILYSLLPALSRNAAGAEERRRLERAMGFLLSAAFTVVLATMVFAGPAVHLLLGASYAESAVALKILIWAVILRYINYALNMRLLAGGHERVFVVTALVCLGVNFLGNVVLIPLYSWRAAAVLTSVTELALLLQNFYWLRRVVGTIPRPHGMVRTSLVFAVLLLAAVFAPRVLPATLAGLACVACFLVYQFSSGMVGEFAAAWRGSRRTA
jgi:O-antigen/teichoic acid export membrane protein